MGDREIISEKREGEGGGRERREGGREIEREKI